MSESRKTIYTIEWNQYASGYWDAFFWEHLEGTPFYHGFKIEKTAPQKLRVNVLADLKRRLLSAGYKAEDVDGATVVEPKERGQWA